MLSSRFFRFRTWVFLQKPLCWRKSHGCLFSKSLPFIPTFHWNEFTYQVCKCCIFLKFRKVRRFLYLSEILSLFVVNVVLDFRQHLNVQWSEPWQMSSRPWLQLSDQGQPSMSWWWWWWWWRWLWWWWDFYIFFIFPALLGGLFNGVLSSRSLCPLPCTTFSIETRHIKDYSGYRGFDVSFHDTVEVDVGDFDYLKLWVFFARW